MNDEYLSKLENALEILESQMDYMKKNYQNFEEQENQLSKNMEAAKLNKNFAYQLTTLALAQKKLNRNLKKDDEILKRTKKIQMRQEKIIKVEQKLKEDQKAYKKSFDSKDQENGLVKKDYNQLNYSQNQFLKII